MPAVLKKPSGALRKKPQGRSGKKQSGKSNWAKTRLQQTTKAALEAQKVEAELASLKAEALAAEEMAVESRRLAVEAQQLAAAAEASKTQLSAGAQADRDVLVEAVEAAGAKAKEMKRQLEAKEVAVQQEANSAAALRAELRQTQRALTEARELFDAATGRVRRPSMNHTVDDADKSSLVRRLFR